MTSLLNLPREMTYEICRRLPFRDLHRIVQTSRKLNAECMEVYLQRKSHLPLATLLYSIFTNSELDYQLGNIIVNIIPSDIQMPPDLQEKTIEELVSSPSDWNRIVSKVDFTVTYMLANEMEEFIDFLSSKLSGERYTNSYFSNLPGNSYLKLSNADNLDAYWVYNINETKSVTDWIPILLPLLDEQVLMEAFDGGKMVKEVINLVDYLPEDM